MNKIASMLLGLSLALASATAFAQEKTEKPKTPKAEKKTMDSGKAKAKKDAGKAQHK